MIGPKLKNAGTGRGMSWMVQCRALNFSVKGFGRVASCGKTFQKQSSIGIWNPPASFENILYFTTTTFKVDLTIENRCSFGFCPSSGGRCPNCFGKLLKVPSGSRRTSGGPQGVWRMTEGSNGVKDDISGVRGGQRGGLNAMSKWTSRGVPWDQRRFLKGSTSDLQGSWGTRGSRGQWGQVRCLGAGLMDLLMKYKAYVPIL